MYRLQTYSLSSLHSYAFLSFRSRHMPTSNGSQTSGQNAMPPVMMTSITNSRPMNSNPMMNGSALAGRLVT